MVKILRGVMVLMWTFSVLGCASLQSQQKPPKVDLTSLYLLPAQGLSQRFNIGIKILNVDRQPLDIQGLHVQLELDGLTLMEGAAPLALSVEGYNEATANVVVSSNLLSSLRFVNKWLKEPGNTQLHYGMTVNLDVKGRFSDLVVKQSGTVDLTMTNPEIESY